PKSAASPGRTPCVRCKSATPTAISACVVLANALPSRRAAVIAPALLSRSPVEGADHLVRDVLAAAEVGEQGHERVDDAERQGPPARHHRQQRVTEALADGALAGTDE